MGEGDGGRKVEESVEGRTGEELRRKEERKEEVFGGKEEERERRREDTTAETQTTSNLNSLTSHDFTTFPAHFFSARPFVRDLKSLVIGPRLDTSPPLLAKTPARSLTPSHSLLPFGAGSKKETLALRSLARSLPLYFHGGKEIVGILRIPRL